MKKSQLSKGLLLIALGGLVACNPLKKMSKEAENVKYDVAPNPLEMHGDSIDMAITGKIPPEYFHKKAVVDVIPVLTTRGDNGDVIQEFDPLTLVGEAADAEGQKITQESGGSFKYEDKIAYKPALDFVSLDVKIVGKFKGKEVEFGTYKVGDGTIITPKMVMADEKPIMGEDEFVKVTPKSIEGSIHYLINRSNVRYSELKDEDFKAMEEFIKMGQEEDFVIKGVKISAYASPDGEISLNENLANDRASSAKKAVERVFSKAKIEDDAEGFYNLEGKGEDWAGFKEAMEASDIEDKDLILRVLQMNKDLAKREKEIKNLAKTYTVIAERILPDLRRSMITINAEKMSRSDEEIQRLVNAAPDSLSVEEMLYAATLTDNLDEKLAIYKQTKKSYPNDWRGHNNVGYILLLQNKANEAKAEFEAALEANSDAKIAMNNLGICYKLSGNVAKAKEYYNNAKGAGKEVNYNLGIINIMNGDYSAAVANFGDYKSFNTALATLLNGDAGKAINAIDASDEKDMAESYYLKAIAGARQGNKDLCINNLKAAISKDASLKKRAMQDAEFIEYMEDEAFKGLF